MADVSTTKSEPEDASATSQEHLYKVLVIGDFGVGKFIASQLAAQASKKNWIYLMFVQIASLYIRMISSLQYMQARLVKLDSYL